MTQLTLTQRWKYRRDILVPLAPFDPRRMEVARLDHATAEAFVLAHHYSGRYPAARFRFGLYQDGALAGVAVFSHPSNDRTLTSVFPGQASDSTELGRLVLLDEVPGNAESWFVARCFKALRAEGIAGVLSFSDPTPRSAPGGDVIHPGHVGIVYQALNARYLGLASPRTLYHLVTGEVFNAKTMQKLRAGERGWRGAVEQLRAAGARPYSEGEDRKAWMYEALRDPRIARTTRHHGNHRYAWALDRAVEKQLAPGMTYPEPPGGRLAPRWGRRAA